MKYFLPDSQDLVDPGFDFTAETRSADRVRHQDDHYAHEVFATRAFDGVLISKAIVDGTGGAGSAKYTDAQRRRLLREGVRPFFRAGQHRWGPLAFMGDCGAFTYVTAQAPPYTVDEVIDFYERCGFDLGLALDHIIREYCPQWDVSTVPVPVLARQQLTLELASEFFTTLTRTRSRVLPVGVAQGWSPRSYAHAVAQLQKIGYEYVALGGVASLRTPDILCCLAAVDEIRRPHTRLHLLGVGRLAALPGFARHGVVSFDSTSPLRQAFLDDRNNYHTLGRSYCAVRVPQVDGNARLMARVRAGEVDRDVARAAERRCLRVLAELAAGERRSLAPVLAALRAYAGIHDPRTDRSEAYREVLEDAPWRRCACEVCEQLGHRVILFRGAQRNRRRGFHNVWTFYQRLRRGLDDVATSRDGGGISDDRTAAPHGGALASPRVG